MADKKLILLVDDDPDLVESPNQENWRLNQIVARSALTSSKQIAL